VTSTSNKGQHAIRFVSFCHLRKKWWAKI